MQEERRLAVLRAIISDYVSTHEPVGSKALVERHNLGVSPATIRNDMAALEEEGYIAQPHTSAGRVPTDMGYRLFVDRLSEVKPLSTPERRAIQRFLDDAVDLDDVMSRTVRPDLAERGTTGRTVIRRTTTPAQRPDHHTRIRPAVRHPSVDSGLIGGYELPLLAASESVVW